jgi:hypothetical protein
MTPDKILRNLENGYFMTHVEQEEAANYIRALQESNRILQEGILKYLEESAAMRRELTQLRKELDERS